MTRTFYDVLGIDDDADDDEIKRSYRRLAKEHHPDVSDDPDAGERFKHISQAADVLTDPDERARYDRLGHEAYLEYNRRDTDWSESAEWTPTGDETTDQSGPTSERDTSKDEGGAKTTGTKTTGGKTAGSGGAGGTSAGARGARQRAGATGASADPEGATPGREGTGAGATGEAMGAQAAAGATAAGAAGRTATADGGATAQAAAGMGATASDIPWEPPRDPSHQEERNRTGDHTRRADTTRRNWWLLALSLIGSGRFLDQWDAFRVGIALVYIYPILLLLVAAEVAPVLTAAAGVGVMAIALYASGIPNVGLFVFGLPGGLFTIFLHESPEFGLFSDVGIVLMAGSWIPLAHTVIVAILLVRS
jgi:hypothetical protein